MMAEVRANTAVSGKCLILQFVVINELGFVYKQPRECQRVRRTRTVLRDDNCYGSVVERDDVFIVSRLGNRLGKGLRGLATNDVVDTVEIAPALPCCRDPAPS